MMRSATAVEVDLGNYSYALQLAAAHAVTEVSGGSISTTSLDPNGNQTSGLGARSATAPTQAFEHHVGARIIIFWTTPTTQASSR